MITPVRANMDDLVSKETRKRIDAKRRFIETIIGQLA